MAGVMGHGPRVPDGAVGAVEPGMVCANPAHAWSLVRSADGVSTRVIFFATIMFYFPFPLLVLKKIWKKD